jgi:hypothetical protein
MRTRKAPVLDPEATARKVAAMALGRAAAHQERLALQTALLERLADMPLEELSRHVNGRQWMAAVFAASGATEPEIARARFATGSCQLSVSLIQCITNIS